MSEIITINGGMPYIILRYFNVYGPRQKDHFIPEFIKRIKKENTNYMDLKTQDHSFIQMMQLKLQLKFKYKKNNEIINIGSNIETKIIDVARLIMRILKKIQKN